MAKKETNGLSRTDWVQRFNLVGEAKITDFTFKLEQRSNKSDWIYNSLNLRVDCGEKSGQVDSELMGGYGQGRENKIFAHGKKEDGTDDFSNSILVAWEDRFDESILEDIGDLSFLTVGLEKDTKDKTFYKKFLSAYDAIAYVHENLQDGTVINVSGQIRYTVYNGNVQCRKEINSIALSKATPEDYHATFTQSILLDKDSVTKDSFDKSTNVLTVDGYVLEKFKEFNGWDLTDGGSVKGGQWVPLRRSFEFHVDTEQLAKMQKLVQTLFKVKKGVTQCSFSGYFQESGSNILPSLDDVPDDIKELISLGIYSEEDALKLCAENGSPAKKMIIERPMIKKIEGADGAKIPVIQKFEEKFEEDDLYMQCLTPKETGEDEEEVAEAEVEAVEESSNEEIDFSDFLANL